MMMIARGSRRSPLLPTLSFYFSSSSKLKSNLKPTNPNSKPFPPLPLSRLFSSKSPTLPLSRDGNYDHATASASATATSVCPGCGVHMQDSDPTHPGFFTLPSSSLSLLPLPSPDIRSPPLVCARCHSLRHYGKVKDPSAENLLPDFDFYHTVGRRLASPSGARSVVLLLVDAADFDGSFPKPIARMVSDCIEENVGNWKEGKPGNVPRLVLVVTKIDLLPTKLSPTRFEHWVRQRARDCGATVLHKVHFVSAVRNWGVKDLVDHVVGLVGPRGNVWAVGTQNAGKSTLINAMGKCAGGVSYLTEAPLPGTTLGIVRVEGVLPGNAKLFDTPGLLNSRQITTRLTWEEQKLLRMSKELKPRTYRIKEGHSVHIGGLMRLDIEKLSPDSIYVTVWASSCLPLHMGKTENAGILLEEHFGRQLQPPIGEKRVQELGKWVRQEFSVSGSSWDSNSMDIAVAGLGWVAIGIKGEATLGVWTYEGVDIVLRNSVIPYRAQTFEVSGFTVSKIVSKADQVLNKSEQSGKRRKRSGQELAIVA